MNGEGQFPAVVTCLECGHDFDGEIQTEYGRSVVVPEDCPHCGSQELDAVEMDRVDIDERRLEARGVDF